MKKRLLFIIYALILLITGCKNIKDNQTAKGKDNIYTLDEYYKTVIDFDIKREDYEAFDNEYAKRNMDYYKDKININYDEMNYDDQYNVQFNTVQGEEGLIVSMEKYNDKIYLITEHINAEDAIRQDMAAHETEIWVHTDDNHYKFEYEVTDNNAIYDFVKTENNSFVIEASKFYSELESTWKIICIDENNNSRIIDQASNYNSSMLLPGLSFSENKIVYLVGDKDKEGNVNHVIKVYDEKEGNLTDAIKVFNVMNPNVMPIIDKNMIYYMDYDELGWYIFKYDIESKNITKYHTGMKEVYERIREFSVSEKYISYTNTFNELYLYDMINNDNKIIDRIVDESAVSDEVCMYMKNGDLFTCHTDDMVVRKLFDDDKYFFYNLKRVNNKFIGYVTNHDTEGEEYYEICHKNQ